MKDLKIKIVQHAQNAKGKIVNYSDTAVFTGKKVAYLSLGCKVNSYETDAIRRQFEELGAESVDFDDACKGTNGVHADVFIINTCSVTNIADRKSRQMLRRARQNNPEAVVAATGCYAQIGAEELIESGCADIVVGNSHKTELVGMVAEKLQLQAGTCGEGNNLLAAEELSGKQVSEKQQSGAGVLNVSSMKDEHCYEDMMIDSCDERVRAFVKIEDGCNQFCTYCIIPYARGRVRSRSEESVIEEIKGLAAGGFKEVVITGIHVSSYGREDYEKTDGFNHVPLMNLIKEVAKLDGIERIRLGSLEPRIICEEFARALAGEPKFCPYFHISLQSGCDTVLKRMNRHYSSSEFKEKIELLRRFFDRPSINTDVIVGFPGESDEEFEQSKDFLEEINFAKMHIFKYSRRRGTVADKMPGQLTDAVKHARSRVLDELDRRNHHAFMEGFIGDHERILIEKRETFEGKDYYVGLTARYVSVAIPADEFKGSDAVNSFADVIPDGFLNDEHLTGHIDGLM